MELTHFYLDEALIEAARIARDNEGPDTINLREIVVGYSEEDDRYHIVLKSLYDMDKETASHEERVRALRRVLDQHYGAYVELTAGTCESWIASLQGVGGRYDAEAQMCKQGTIEGALAELLDVVVALREEGA